MFWIFHIVFLSISYFVIGRLIAKSAKWWQGWPFFAVSTLTGFIFEKWNSDLELEFFSYFFFALGFIIGALLTTAVLIIAVNACKIETNTGLYIVSTFICVILTIILFTMNGSIRTQFDHHPNGGNENDCRNCGRPRMNNSVYCEDCFESFYEWSQDYYDDKYN